MEILFQSFMKPCARHEVGGGGGGGGGGGKKRNIVTPNRLQIFANLNKCHQLQRLGAN